MIPFVEESKIYKPSEIEEMIKESVSKDMVIHSNKGKQKITYYYNVPCSLDIEVSSFYTEDKEKAATMYVWQFGLNGRVVIGRTWQELNQVITAIGKALKININRRLVIYVHNLSYEFQFICHYFEWENVFGNKPREPIYALTSNGLEFRCSYLLSGYSLKVLGDKLHKYKVQKMVGDLDYSKLRGSNTPLTDKELKYCENDVRVVMAYIQESIEAEASKEFPNGNIDKIPYTKTGFVRRECRENCLYLGLPHRSHKATNQYNRYHGLMSKLTIDTEDEYRQLKRAFQGGFTHANAYMALEVHKDVSSYDFTSSYPYVMVAEKFPMSKSRLVTFTGPEEQNREEFKSYLKSYCCLFTVRFTNIRAKIGCENYISESKCANLKGAVANNGRIAFAYSLDTTITEVDFNIIERFYNWDKMEIGHFRIYRKGYLPTEFVKSILKFYKVKTELKGVEDKELDYNKNKEMLNSCYGMAVMDICRDRVSFSDDIWKVEEANIEESLAEYNESMKRFMFYPWGVWVTAYARRNLFTGIYEFRNDYIYSDTDSLKVLNIDNHIAYINNYNNGCKKRLELACKHHDIPLLYVEPQTVKGESKLLGVWDYEGIYNKFKTLGAKRYMVEYGKGWKNHKEGTIDITVSGVNKKAAVPYLVETFGKNGNDGVFEAFDDGLFIPAGYTGKNLHTYIDTPIEGDFIDYLGNKCHYRELSVVHMEESEYMLSLTKEWLDYLSGIRRSES